MPPSSRIDLVQDLYRAAASCADHHDSDTVELLHIETAVDSFVLKQTQSGKVVFVTGNPGDGKTHLLRRHAATLDEAGVEVCLDANERTDTDLIAFIENGLRRERGSAIAINQGILVELLREAKNRPWAVAVRDQLLMPFDYRSSLAETPPVTHLGSKAVVVDLNLRNNLGPSVVERALRRMLSLCEHCAHCSPSQCRGAANVARLAKPSVVRRIVALLDQVSRTGVHATMRDLQGFLSHVLFAGQRCEDSLPARQQLPPYWTNAFEGGVGPLFDAVRRFDPVNLPSPMLDDRLWRRADVAHDWLEGANEAAPQNEGLEARRLGFINRKRRGLFEHREGATLVENAGTSVDRLFRALTEREVNRSRSVVRMLNRFFDRDEEQDDVLFLWVSHRYDARSSRYAAHAVSVPTSNLEIAIPTLPEALSRAFPDFRPNHVILRAKDSPKDEGLKIDRRFLEALESADSGLPTTFRRGEPEARIAAFYDRLAKRAWKAASSDALRVRLVDIDTGRNMALTIDVANRRYQQY